MFNTVEFDCPGRYWATLRPDVSVVSTPTFWDSKSCERGMVLPNCASVAICELAVVPGVKVVNVPFCTPNHTGARAKPPPG